jgi:hypothetical protein
MTPEDIPYPENTVWYIEARPWSRNKDSPGFAQADPESMGSAVVVMLETLDEDFRPRQGTARKYLLTCAHVVRRVSDNPQDHDALLEEIVCFPPGTGYLRTQPDTRKCGTFTDSEALVARVSPLSRARERWAPAVRTSESRIWTGYCSRSSTRKTTRRSRR